MASQENVKHLEDCSVSKVLLKPLDLNDGSDFSCKRRILGDLHQACFVNYLYLLIIIGNTKPIPNIHHLICIYHDPIYNQCKDNPAGPSLTRVLQLPPMCLRCQCTRDVGVLSLRRVGVKRKSLAPLLFCGTTCTMLDIIIGVSQCEREQAEHQMKMQEAAQNAVPKPESETEDSQSCSL